MKYKNNIILLLLITIICLSITVVLFIKPKITNIETGKTLTEKGYIYIPQILPNEILDELKRDCEMGDYKTAKHTLLSRPEFERIFETIFGNGSGYGLQDYIWIIQKSAVTTCHRDNNGDFFNKGQKHPSYTLLIYLEDMENQKCLSVYPESHKSWFSHFFNFYETLTDISCGKGSMILFNANLIHVGTILPNPNNLRIQLKVSHKDDIEVLHYYQNFNKVLNQENNTPNWWKMGIRSLSCAFAGMSNFTQDENIRTARGSQEGVEIGIFQKIFSTLFYGNSNYYDLPNF